MILTTTPSIEGKKITAYKGIITSEAIMGANIVRDFLSGISDIIGGRAGMYEEKLQEARDICLRELEYRASRIGANAVVGIDLDYEVVGQGGSMLMVSASGTAVVIE